MTLEKNAREICQAVVDDPSSLKVMQSKWERLGRPEDEFYVTIGDISPDYERLNNQTQHIERKVDIEGHGISRIIEELQDALNYFIEEGFEDSDIFTEVDGPYSSDYDYGCSCDHIRIVATRHGIAEPDSSFASRVKKSITGKYAYRKSVARRERTKKEKEERNKARLVMNEINGLEISVEDLMKLAKDMRAKADEIVKKEQKKANESLTKGL